MNLFIIPYHLLFDIFIMLINFGDIIAPLLYWANNLRCINFLRSHFVTIF